MNHQTTKIIFWVDLCAAKLSYSPERSLTVRETLLEEHIKIITLEDEMDMSHVSVFGIIL